MARNERSQVSERVRVGKTCDTCGFPLIGDDCQCTGIDYRQHIDVLFDRFPGDIAARKLRQIDGLPDPCEGGHSGPWTIVSRHTSTAPHAQCAGCGHIDRSGDMAREIGAVD